MSPQLGVGEGEDGRASPLTPGMLKRRINRASVEEGFPLPCLPGRTDGPPLQLGICRLRNGFLVRTVSAVWVRGRGAVPVGPGGAAGPGGRGGGAERNGAMDALRQRLAAARRGCVGGAAR